MVFLFISFSSKQGSRELLINYKNSYKIDQTQTNKFEVPNFFFFAQKLNNIWRKKSHTQEKKCW